MIVDRSRRVNRLIVRGRHDRRFGSSVAEAIWLNRRRRRLGSTVADAARRILRRPGSTIRKWPATEVLVPRPQAWRSERDICYPLIVRGSAIHVSRDRVCIGGLDGWRMGS